MKFAERMKLLAPSATFAVNTKALELKAQGIQVISLAVGEPDAPTPAHICEAAKKAIDENFSKYTPVNGILELRQAVCGYFKRQYGVVCAKPAGAFYLFPDVSALYTPEIPDSTAMCTYLLEKAHVACVPGEAFGDPNCIRLSYAVSDDILMDALRRMREALYN